VHPHYIPLSDLVDDPTITAVRSQVPLEAISAPPLTYLDPKVKIDLMDEDESVLVQENEAQTVLFEDDLEEERVDLPFVSVRFADIEAPSDQELWQKVQQRL
jgi:hypothetical protein